MNEIGSANFEMRLLAAEGYLKLGMTLDANAELKEIEPDLRDESTVLALRVKIYRKLEKWELTRAVAGTLALREPDNVQWATS